MFSGILLVVQYLVLPNMYAVAQCAKYKVANLLGIVPS